jgi:putative N6-adenine-specific DNA methylase
MTVPSPDSELLEFYAAAIPGTEKVLCEELRELGFSSVRLNRGGVPFRGTWQDGWRACLESRIAQRIQVLVKRFPAPSQDALYAGLRDFDWTRFVTYRQTLSVSAVCRASAINHSGFAALKIKDAIVDQVREKTQRRPDVDREDPDVRVFAHLANDKVAVYLDLAGVPRHRRGYRQETGEAPLRETLAAAILRMSQWDRKSTLTDPMCGSGTIAIEAAMLSAGIAPGLLRERFGFERWANFADDSEQAMRELRGHLRGQAARGQCARILASDEDPTVIDIAKQNARTAGIKPAFRQRSILEQPPSGESGTLITNPPYGVRLDKDPQFCRQFGAVVTRLHGWRVGIMAGSPDYKREISVSPRFSIPLKNGDLDCEFLVYDIE